MKNIIKLIWERVWRCRTAPDKAVDSVKPAAPRSIYEYLVYIFLFLLPWQTVWIYREIFLQKEKFEYATLGLYMTEILLWIIIVMFSVSAIKNFLNREGRPKFSWTRDRQFILSLLVFVLYAFVSSFWAPDSAVAQQHALRTMEAILIFLVLMISNIDIWKAVFWFVSGAFTQSLLALWQFIAQKVFASAIFGIATHDPAELGVSVVSGEGVGRVLRAYGGFSHPNVLGGFLVIALFFCLLLIARTAGNKKESNLLQQTSGVRKKTVFSHAFLLYVYVLCISAGIFVSFSRSAWLGFCAVPGVAIYMYVKRVLSRAGFSGRIILRTIFVAVITFAVLTSMFFGMVHNRIAGTGVHEQTSIAERVMGAREALNIIRDNLFFGVGAGNYAFALATRISGLPGWAYQPVHNVDLLFFAEYGIVGLLLFLWVIIAWLRFCRPNALVMYALIIYAFLAVFDHYLFSSYIGLVLTGVYCGLILRISPQVLHK